MSNPPGWSSGASVPPPPPPSGRNPRLRPLNTGDVLDGMFRLAVRHWRVYLPVVAAVVVPTQLLVAIVERDIVSDVGLLDVFTDPEAAQQAAAGPGLVDFGSPVLLGLVLSLLVTPLVAGAAAWIGARAHLGEPVDAGAALRVGLRRYFALVGANLLTWLALAAAAALAIVPLIGLSAFFDLGFGAALLLWFPTILVVLAAAAVVSALFLVAPVVVVVEQRGPIASMARSVRLVRRRFWGVLGIGLLAWIVSGLVGMVLSWPFSLPALLLGGSPALFFTTAGALVAGIASAPLMPNARALLYADLRVRAEGLDLEAMADAVAPPGTFGSPDAPGTFGSPDAGGRPA